MSDRVTSLSLLDRLRDPRDDAAWQRFHDLYGPLVLQWLRRRGVVQADADDVMQEVMRQAVVELPKFQHNGRLGALRCWLRQVVSNRLRTFWRQRNRLGVTGGEPYGELADQLADPNSELSRQWDAEYHRDLCERLLEMAKAEFQPATMEAFRRVALEGRKAAEVADELGLTANAVRIAQSRVMRRLRELGADVLE